MIVPTACRLADPMGEYSSQASVSGTMGWAAVQALDRIDPRLDVQVTRDEVGARPGPRWHALVSGGGGRCRRVVPRHTRRGAPGSPPGSLVRAAPRAVVQILDLHVTQEQVVVGVQEIGQPVRMQPHRAEDAVVSGVRGEPYQRGLGHRVGFEDLLVCLLEREVQGRRAAVSSRRTLGEGRTGVNPPKVPGAMRMAANRTCHGRAPWVTLQERTGRQDDLTRHGTMPGGGAPPWVRKRLRRSATS